MGSYEMKNFPQNSPNNENYLFNNIQIYKFCIYKLKILQNLCGRKENFELILKKYLNLIKKKVIEIQLACQNASLLEMFQASQ